MRPWCGRTDLTVPHINPTEGCAQPSAGSMNPGPAPAGPGLRPRSGHAFPPACSAPTYQHHKSITRHWRTTIMNAIRRIAATAVLDAAALAGCVGLAGVADAAPVTDRPGKLKGRRQWHDHRYRQALDHPRPTRRRPPCPPAPLAVRRRRPPVDRRIRTAAAVSSRSQPARPASVAYVDHPPVEQGPPSCPGAARAAAFEAEQAH